MDVCVWTSSGWTKGSLTVTVSNRTTAANKVWELSAVKQWSQYPRLRVQRINDGGAAVRTQWMCVCEPAVCEQRDHLLSLSATGQWVQRKCESFQLLDWLTTIWLGTHHSKRQLEICLRLLISYKALKAPPKQSYAIHKIFSSTWHWRASWSPLAQDSCISSHEPIGLKGRITTV